MGRTSIPCSDEVRDELKALKESRGQDWDAFLADFAREREPNADNSNELPIEEIAREVSRQLDYSQMAGQVARELESRGRGR